MTNFPQSTVDDMLDQARNNAAGMAENAATAQRIIAEDPREGTGAIGWLAIACCFALGVPGVFICVPWMIVTGELWTIIGTVFSLVLLALGTAAADRMLKRGGGR